MFSLTTLTLQLIPLSHTFFIPNFIDKLSLLYIIFNFPCVYLHTYLRCFTIPFLMCTLYSALEHVDLCIELLINVV